MTSAVNHWLRLFSTISLIWCSSPADGREGQKEAPRRGEKHLKFFEDGNQWCMNDPEHEYNIIPFLSSPLPSFSWCTGMLFWICECFLLAPWCLRLTQLHSQVFLLATLQQLELEHLAQGCLMGDPEGRSGNGLSLHLCTHITFKRPLRSTSVPNNYYYLGCSHLWPNRGCR